MKNYLRIVFRNKGLLYNEGFAIVNTSKSRIESLEAVLTDDFLRMDAIEGMISLKYFSAEDDGKALKMVIALWMDQDVAKVVPTLDFTAETADNMEISVETEYTIVDQNEIAKCNQRLTAFKENHVFIFKERE